MAKKGKLVVGVVVLALIVGALVYFGLRDEELTPAARSVLSARAPNIPDEQNAYFLLLGLDAPVGSDPLTTARTLVDEQRARLAVPRGERKEPPARKASFSVPKEFGREFCDGAINDCLRVYQRAELEVLRAVADNPVFVQRCDSLYGYASFADVSIPALDDLLVPSFNIAVSCARLTHALAAIDLKHGRTVQALSRLARDTTFWRMLLARSNTLIAKMAAITTLRLRGRLLSDVIGLGTLVTTGDPSQLTELTRPLTPAEMDLTTTWRWESIASTRMLSELDRVGLRQVQEWESSGPEAWLMLGGYRPNATINVFVRRFEQISALCRNKPGFIVANRDTLTAQVERSATGNALYNPVGKILVGLGVPEFVDYALRIHDLDAQMRLVRLKQQILAQRVADSSVQAFLNQSAPTLFDPYTERPMNWDPKQRLLWSSAHGRSRPPSPRVEVAL